MRDSKLKSVLQRLGFEFPREHGLTMIWLSAIILGTTLSLLEDFKIEGLILALLFSIIVLLSHGSIRKSVKTRFSENSWTPGLFVLIFSISLWLWRPTWQMISVFLLLGSLFGIWVVLAQRKHYQHTGTLIIGSLDLSLLFPLILVSSIARIDETRFFEILAIWWLFAGMTVLLIMHVQRVRNKVALGTPFVTWLIFLLSFALLFLNSLLEPLLVLALVEPTLNEIIQLLKSRKPVSARPRLKRIGLVITIRLFLFITIILLSSLFVSL
ncbi:MAG: hypothetical protein ACE5OZ_06635 [Candidatus Heimdallarchaeota archaeon]